MSLLRLVTRILPPLLVGEDANIALDGLITPQEIGTPLSTEWNILGNAWVSETTFCLPPPPSSTTTGIDPFTRGLVRANKLRITGGKGSGTHMRLSKEEAGFLVSAPLQLPPETASEDTEALHRCLVCGFQCLDSLEAHHHVSRHLSVFNCSICDQVFTSRHLLQRHSLTSHKRTDASGNFRCDSCDEVFISRHLLQRHVLVLHKKSDCDLCHLTFPSRQVLQRHLVTVHQKSPSNRFKCNECEQTFLTRQRLLHHTLNSHKKNGATKKANGATSKGIHCPLCGEVLKRRQLHEHMALHANYRPHKCFMCSRKFRTPDALYRHHATHKDTTGEDGFNEASGNSHLPQAGHFQTGTEDLRFAVL